MCPRRGGEGHGMAASPHSPHRLLKRIALAVALVAAGIAAAAYFGYRRLSPLPELAVSPRPGLETMRVERVHQSATREGRTEWSLDAATAQYLLNEKKVLLTDLSVTFFTRDDQQVYLTARRGTLMTDSHDMEAHEEVVIYNDAYRLETEKMAYAHAARMITSDVPVKISGQAGELLADSLAVDLRANRLVMRGHVHGTLASNETQKPVRIQSEQLIAETETDTAEFRDLVRVEGEGYTITGDRLTVRFQPGSVGQNRLSGALSAKEISRMAARGHVLIRTDTLAASTEQADYEPSSGRAWLGPEDGRLPAEAPRPGGRTGAGRGPAAQRVKVTLLPTPGR
jgi:LPS export ABC transporter protein LptC